VTPRSPGHDKLSKVLRTKCGFRCWLIAVPKTAAVNATASELQQRALRLSVQPFPHLAICATRDAAPSSGSRSGAQSIFERAAARGGYSDAAATPCPPCAVRPSTAGQAVIRASSRNSLLEGLAPETVDGPVVQRARTQAAVELDRRRVPIQY
jgi:hypothetical protein